MKDNDIKEKFLELRASGLSYDKIAKELNVSKQTLISWSKDYKYDLSNLKAIELDRLQQEYYISKMERIKLFGERLKLINKELNKRNFENLTTEKLLEYQMKFLHMLKEDENEIIFKKETRCNLIDEATMFEKQIEDQWEA